MSVPFGVALIAPGLVAVPSATATVYTWGGVSSGILELMVYSSFSSLVVGVIMTFRSTLNLIDSFSKSQEERSANSWLVKLRLITRDRSLRNVRVATTGAYGLFLSILSGILLFQTAQSFSTTYRVEILSSTFAVCGGSIGHMPQLLVYLSDRVEIVATP